MRAKVNRSDSRILGRLTAEMIHVFVFAGNDELDADDHVRLAHQVITGPAVPGEIVGEVVLMRAVAAGRELHVSFKEKIAVTQRALPADDAVKGTCPQRQVVPMNTALGRAGS